MSIDNPVYKIISISTPDSDDLYSLLVAKASGLERSVNGGKTWQNAYHSLGVDEPVGTLAVAAAILSDQRPQVFAGLSGGILFAKLKDGNQDFSWQQAQVPSPPPVIIDFAISPNFASDGLVLAATLEDGVLRSNDHGQSWMGWNFNLLDQTVLCLEISPHFVEDHIVFAGSESGVFVSKNEGKSWIELELPTDYDPILSMALSPDFGMGNCLWVGTETKGLWFSHDTGKNWERVKHFDIETPINAIQILQSPTGHYQIAVMSDEGIKFRSLSIDLEETWQDFQPPLNDDTRITAICAPFGLGQGERFWLGFSNGQVSTFGE